MFDSTRSKQKNQLAPITTRQQCFIKNLIENQPIKSSNSQHNLFKSSSKNPINNNAAIKNQSKSKGHEKQSLSVRRSYGSINFNHDCKIQLNNRGSIQDYMICSDVVVKNEAKKQVQLNKSRQKSLREAQQLRKHPVNIKTYQKHLKTQQIADAYYFVDRQIHESEQRQKANRDTIDRVKSLSRTKSHQQALQFRNKQRMNLNCIDHLLVMEQKYRKQVVPELMGTRGRDAKRLEGKLMVRSQRTLVDDNYCQNAQSQTDRNRDTNKNQSQLKIDQLQSQEHSLVSNRSHDLMNSAKHTASTGMFRTPFGTGTALSSTQRLPQSPTQLLQNTLKSTSLLRTLQKSKSTQQFLQKQRVKIVKQAFIQNWRQGPNKKQDKYQCKYTEKMKQQKQKEIEQQQREHKQKIYGKKFTKKNTLDSLPKSSQKDFITSRYTTLKQYQLQFSQIANTKIPSCVITRN